MADFLGKKIIIRADASYEIGTGHVMRMLCLADGLRKCGADIVFCTRPFGGSKDDAITAEGFTIHSLSPTVPNFINIDDTKTWLGASTADDVDQTFSMNPCDIAIVDHYGVDMEWCNLARKNTNKIICIDDEAIRPLDCDILVNPNYFGASATATPLHQNLPVHCIRLVGPDYAMVRPEFATLRASTMRRVKMGRVLILMGGRDVHGIGLKILNNIPDDPGFSITCIGGDNQTEAICHQKGFRYIAYTADIANLMKNSDFCIGAAGSASWERCCLKLPSALFVIADNQEKIAENLAHDGYCINFGRFQNYNFNQIYDFLNSLRTNEAIIPNLSEKCGSLVDGKGVERIVERIAGLKI